MFQVCNIGDSFDSIIPFVMDKIEQELPPPNLFSSLRHGFDTVAAHPELLLMPLGIDLFIWLGPHLHLRTRMAEVFAMMNAQAVEQGGWPSPEVASLVNELKTLFVERLNLLTFLRSYPVGVPSVMAANLPVATPIGSYPDLDVVSLGAIAGWWLLLTLAGLALGIFYYRMVAQITLHKQVTWMELFKGWPRLTLNTFGLWLLWSIAGLLVSVPFTILSMVTGPAAGMFASLCLLTALAVALYPLIFTAHSLALYGDTLMTALRRSWQVSRLAMPMLVTFLMAVFVLSQFLDTLWRAPDEASWLALLGIGGHAFVSSAFMAASFSLFNDAVVWVQRLSTARAKA